MHEGREDYPQRDIYEQDRPEYRGSLSPAPASNEHRDEQEYEVAGKYNGVDYSEHVLREEIVHDSVEKRNDNEYHPPAIDEYITPCDNSEPAEKQNRCEPYKKKSRQDTVCYFSSHNLSQSFRKIIAQ